MATRFRTRNSTPTPTDSCFFGAFLATVTKTLRIGQCGICLPDHHPIRVAENVAMLDHMTEGRVDFGMIRGINNRVSGNFNPDGDRRNQERNKALFWESFEVIMKAWSGEPFTHRGEFYTFPCPGWQDAGNDHGELDPRYYSADGELITLSVQPTPYQKPTPPCWVMADSLSTTVESAAHGCGVISWAKSFAATREQTNAYRETAEKEFGSEEAASGRLGIMRTVYVAETREEAERVMRPAVNGLLRYVDGLTPSWNGRKAFLAKDEELTDEDMSLDWFDFLNGRGWCLVGTPEDVTGQLKQFETEVGLEHFIAYWALPAISYEQFVASTKLFADRVMPNF